MDFVVVPRKATTRRAIVWVGAFSTKYPREKPPRAVLKVGSNTHAIEAWMWTPILSGEGLWHAMALVEPRQPRENISLLVNGDEVASGEVMLLPAKLGTQALIDAQHSVVILSGDLHWGRIAYGRKTNKKLLLEVISSPLEMRFPRSVAGYLRPWHRALPTFGSKSGRGIEIETECEYKRTKPHFVTLDFAKVDGAVSLAVRAWPDLTSGREGEDPVFRCTL